MAAIYVPEEQGGSGLSRLDGALIMEALAYGCPAISGYISIHNMVAWMVAKYASDAQVAAWMPKLASMDWLSSYCLTEPGAGSDAAALKTSAKRTGDHYVLNGSKQFISGAGAADFYFVFARTGERGRQRHLGLRGDEGHARAFLRRQREEDGLERAADPPGDLRQLQGAGRQSASARRATASRFAMSGLDGGRINIGACSLGAAWCALDKARAVHARAQGVRPASIADFQALQFKIADMATDLEAARLMIYRAADAHRPRRSTGLHVLGDGQAPGHRLRLRGVQRGAADPRRLRLSQGLRPRKAGARSAGCIRSWKAPTRSCAW